MVVLLLLNIYAVNDFFLMILIKCLLNSMLWPLERAGDITNFNLLQIRHLSALTLLNTSFEMGIL
jgi:hypothetical protein